MATWKHIIKLKDEEIIKHVEDDFLESQTARERINARNLLCLKAYHAVDVSKPLDHVPLSTDNNNLTGLLGMFNAAEESGNAFYPPFARGVILAYWALLSMNLFPNNEKWLEVLPNEKLDEGAADAFQQVARQLYREIDYVSEADLAIVQALNMDVSVLYTGWAVEPDYVPTVDSPYVEIPDPNDPTQKVPTNMLRDVRELKYNYMKNARSLPDYWTMNTFNIRVAPGTPHGSLHRSNPLYFGCTVKMSKADFHRRVEAKNYSECDITKDGHLKIGGVVLDDDEPCGGADGDNTSDFEQIVYEDTKSDAAEDTGASENHYRLSLYWQKFAYVIVVNNKYVAHKAQTKGWPFSVLRSYPQQGQFSGCPVMADLIEIQHDITTMTRSRRNEQDERAYPKPLIDYSQFASEDAAVAAVMGSDRVIPYDSSKNPEARNKPVEYLEYRHQMGDTLTEQREEQQFGEKVTGAATESVLGSYAPGPRRTATESTNRAGGGAIRTGWIMRNFKKALIQDPTYELYRLGQEFLTREFKARVAGVDGTVKYEKWTKNDWMFNTPPEITAVGLDQLEDRMTDAQIFMNAFGFAMSNPLTAQLVKASPNLVTLYRKMGIENPEKYLVTENELDFKMPPKFEIQLLIQGADVPLSPHNDPKQHLDAIHKFIESPEWAPLSDEAKRRISQRGIEYKQVMDASQAGGGMGGGMAGGMVPSSPTAPNAAGGMMSGGANQTTQAEGQVNRMAGGPGMGR